MVCFVFSNATATTEIYTLSLHDALPISASFQGFTITQETTSGKATLTAISPDARYIMRSEEHTSELQSLRHLVCRLLLEKKTRSVSAPLADDPTRHHARADPLRLTTARL